MSAARRPGERDDFGQGDARSSFQPEMPKRPLPTAAPGSAEAVAQGCICPRMDNAYGRGYLGGMKDPDTGETMYVRVTDCPMHGAAAEDAKPKGCAA